MKYEKRQVNYILYDHIDCHMKYRTQARMVWHRNLCAATTTLFRSHAKKMCAYKIDRKKCQLKRKKTKHFE